MKRNKKLLLLGWDAADWKSINPLMDLGFMPNLKNLVDSGVMGKLATMDPPLSPMLWTSIATGMRPVKHGIHGFTEVVKSTGKIRPIYGSNRKVRTFWDILSSKELKTHVVGWWPSHPAEKVNGIFISNFYQKATDQSHDDWSMMTGTVFPKEKAGFFQSIRVHPHTLTQAHLFPFIPKADQLDQSNKRNQQLLSAVRKITAETATIHNAGTYIMENEDWDCVAVYFDGIDHYCHGFMKFSPPRMDSISQQDYEMWRHVIDSAYRFFDMLLGRYMELAGDAAIMLISDHGFQTGALRPEQIPHAEEHAAPAMEHSTYGIICASGYEFKEDERVYGCSILDITPTILQYFDLPVGKDMDGKVLVNLFESPKDIEYIDSWDKHSWFNDLKVHDAHEHEDKYLLDQLVALGYVEKPNNDPDKAARDTLAMNRYFLARSLMDANMYSEAHDIFKELWEQDRSKRAYAINLAKCYSMLGETLLLEEIMDDMIERDISDTSYTHVIRGNLYMQQHKFRSALKQFKLAEEKKPNLHKINFQIGNGYLALRQFANAESAFQKELTIDAENPFAHFGLGMSHKMRGHWVSGAESFLNALGLMYNYPAAHYQYGECLIRLQMYREATEAFEVALKQAPGFNTARAQLINLYSDQLKDPKKVEQLKTAMDYHIEAEIIVVSGLPRSGTSMMMQMLEKGRIAPFTDDKRKADVHNPKGYYEHEAIKSIARDKNFLFDIGNKAVKIVAPLLSELPFRFSYKIIFMNRNLNEIINSQHTMLRELKKISSDTLHPEIEYSFTKTLKKVHQMARKRKNFQVLFLDYSDVLENPKRSAEMVRDFLNKPLDVERMATAVESKLYRERMTSKEP